MLALRVINTSVLTKNNKLVVAEKQQLNGNDVIKLAGSGSLYVQQCVGPKSKGKNPESQGAEIVVTDQKEVCDVYSLC